MNRKLLITGNGRSGTLSMKNMLRKGLGLDIGHEYVQEDGTCSLYFFDDFDFYPVIPWGPPKGLNAHVGQKFSDFEFDHIFHQVRHPLKVIPSMAMIYSRPIMDWFEQVGVVPCDVKPRLYKSAMIWLEVCKRADDLCDYRYRIEDIEKEWPKLCRKMGYKGISMPEIRHCHRASKSRKRVIRLEDISKYDSTLAKNIAKQARKYKYEV